MILILPGYLSDSSTVPLQVMYVTFHDNVFLGLNLSFTIWAAGRECRGTSRVMLSKF